MFKKLKQNRATKTCTVTRYARRVVAGEIVASKWVRLACKRHLDDLETGHERGLVWDQAASEHAQAFFSFLVHSKGRWAKQQFILSDWQEFLTGSIIGWKLASGERRFRIAFIELARKNGKTTWAAGLALYLLVCDGEAAAEIYSAATKKDQARLVFEDAKALVQRSPDLSEIVNSYKYYLEIPESRSKFEPLGADSDGLDGLNPFMIVCDEIHAWKSRDTWDVLLTGMGARTQPLALAITTAGDFSESIYNELRTDAESILEGVVKDDSVFGYIACLDAEDDWLDESTWKKANPNLGISLRIEELQKVVQEATRKPAAQNKIKRNRLGIRTNALNAWLQLDQWDKGANPTFNPSSLFGQQCWCALDIANTSDLTAFSLIFVVGMIKGEPIYRVLTWYFCPSDSKSQYAERLRRILYPMRDLGNVEFTEGESIDISRIEEVVIEQSKNYDIQAIAYDPWNCESTAQNLIDKGLNCFRFNQNIGNYNEPSKELEKAVIDGRLQHNGNPVTRWMASNVVTYMNGAGLIMPSRKSSREKIDGVVSIVMAIGCYLRVDAVGDSVYESRGIDE